MTSVQTQILTYLFLSALLTTTTTFEGKAQLFDAGITITDGKINWDHFTGQAEANTSYWAKIYWGVYYRYKTLPFHGDTVRLDLQTWTVVKKESWVLPDKKSEELLQHEQGHFNFALLSASEFKKSVLSMPLLHNNYAQKIDSVFKAVLTKYKAMELQYDEETNHMLHKKKQAIWNERLDALLKP